MYRQFGRAGPVSAVCRNRVVKRWFALHSDSWAATRLFTWFVAAAYLIILIVMLAALATDTAGARWQAGIIELVIVVGFGWESACVRHTAGPAPAALPPIRPQSASDREIQ